jgi:hypothetical protein
MLERNTFRLNITVNCINLKLNYEWNIAIELLVLQVFICGCLGFIFLKSTVWLSVHFSFFSDPLGVCLDTKLKGVTAASLHMLSNYSSANSTQKLKIQTSKVSGNRNISVFLRKGSKYKQVNIRYDGCIFLTSTYCIWNSVLCGSAREPVKIGFEPGGRGIAIVGALTQETSSSRLKTLDFVL